MKKLLLILLLFVGSFQSFSQGMIINPVIAKQSEYARPQDWIKISQYVATTDQKCVILHAVYNLPYNLFSCKNRGAYNVKIYKGKVVVDSLISSTDVADNNVFSTNLVYATYGNLTTRNYRQAIIVITPQGGSNLTKLLLCY